MPIIVKAKGRDTTNDLIKKFKKLVSAVDLVQRVKDRRFYTKPSQERQVRKNEIRRWHKRYRTMKKMKNLPARMIPKGMEELFTK